MAWSIDPGTPIYGQGALKELVSFNVSISYSDTVSYPTDTWDVVLTAVEPKTNIILSSGASASISGYYSSSFDGYNITFLSKSGNYITVDDWNGVSNVRELVSFHPPMVQYKTFYYNATATSTPSNIIVNTQFSIIVTNDWDVGKNQLKTVVNNSISER
jgi:hypothetical protein